MEPTKLVDFYSQYSADQLKLEYLKARTQLRALREQQENETDEYFREQIALKIKQLENSAQTIDDVWYFRYQTHIPYDDK